eukprot:6110700-Alexandrium_andersonii.AAC.1
MAPRSLRRLPDPPPDLRLRLWDRAPAPGDRRRLRVPGVLRASSRFRVPGRLVPNFGRVPQDLAPGFPLRFLGLPAQAPAR